MRASITLTAPNGTTFPLRADEVIAVSDAPEMSVRLGARAIVRTATAGWVEAAETPRQIDALLAHARGR